MKLLVWSLKLLCLLLSIQLKFLIKIIKSYSIDGTSDYTKAMASTMTSRTARCCRASSHQSENSKATPPTSPPPRPYRHWQRHQRALKLRTHR